MVLNETIEPDFGSSDMMAQRKLRELILYIADKSADDPRFGATKLNKILYFSDFGSYRRRGKPITGAEYRKRKFGPAPRVMPIVQNEMKQDGDGEEMTMIYHGREQHRFVAHRRASLNDLFSPEDIEFVNDVMYRLRYDDARTVSDRSHGIAWLIAERDAKIPYQSAFLSNDLPTDADWEWVRQEIKDDMTNASAGNS